MTLSIVRAYRLSTSKTSDHCCKVGCGAALVRTVPDSVWSATVTPHSLFFYFQFNTMHRLRRCSHVFKPDFSIITKGNTFPPFSLLCVLCRSVFQPLQPEGARC